MKGWAFTSVRHLVRRRPPSGLELPSHSMQLVLKLFWRVINTFRQTSRPFEHYLCVLEIYTFMFIGRDHAAEAFVVASTTRRLPPGPPPLQQDNARDCRALPQVKT